MKLSQLKQIIKEEIEEAERMGFKHPGDNFDTPSPYQNGIMDTLKAMQQLGVNIDVQAVMDIIYPDDESPVNERRINEDEDVPLTKDVKRYIDGQIKDAKKSRSPERLKKYLTNPAVLDNSLTSLILLAFEDKYPDAIDVTDEVKKYILSQIPM